MNKLIQLLDEIAEYGKSAIDSSENNELRICYLLSKLYAEYLNLDHIDLDDVDYNSEPSFDYNSIRKNVEINFPNFGWYHTITDSHKLIEVPDIATGDAIDDLTDIIKDVLEVRWTIENHSLNNGLWQFNFLMKHHSEQHLVNFLKYAKDLKG